MENEQEINTLIQEALKELTLNLEKAEQKIDELSNDNQLLYAKVQEISEQSSINSSESTSNSEILDRIEQAGQVELSGEPMSIAVIPVGDGKTKIQNVDRVLHRFRPIHFSQDSEILYITKGSWWFKKDNGVLVNAELADEMNAVTPTITDKYITLTLDREAQTLSLSAEENVPEDKNSILIATVNEIVSGVAALNKVERNQIGDYHESKERENNHSFHWDPETLTITPGFYAQEGLAGAYLPVTMPTPNPIASLPTSTNYYLAVVWDSVTNGAITSVTLTAGTHTGNTEFIWYVDVLQFDSEGVCIERRQDDLILPQFRIIEPSLQSHKDTHDPEDGSDPLDTAAPATNISGTPSTNETGTAHSFSRSDHGHAVDTTGADANLVSGTAGVSGNLGSWNADGDMIDSGVPASTLSGLHNDLGSIQGGAVNDYYHLTSVQRAALTDSGGVNNADLQHSHDYEPTGSVSAHESTYDHSLLHEPLTVLDSSEIDFTLTGQQLTAIIIAGSITEAKLNASINASLDLADSASQPGHTHTASEVTDFDAEVSNNTDVAANTAARHDAITLHADADANLLNLTGQEIDLDTQAANKIFAGPALGSDAKPTFRTLVADDIAGLIPSHTELTDEIIYDHGSSYEDCQPETGAGKYWTLAFVAIEGVTFDGHTVPAGKRQYFMQQFCLPLTAQPGYCVYSTPASENLTFIDDNGDTQAQSVLDGVMTGYSGVIEGTNPATGEQVTATFVAGISTDYTGQISIINDTTGDSELLRIDTDGKIKQ